MKFEVFAILKDYFQPEFDLQTTAANIEAVKQELVKLQPAALDVLSTCRFAVNDEFIDNEFQLKESDTICIIPPSSGG
ncbi:MAG: MoaD/ThiS family protein [Ferruginibacter sp.]